METITFHLPTALWTVILAPLAYFLGGILLGWLKAQGAYAIEGILYWLARSLRRSVASTLTLRRYCRLQLQTGSKYLSVPAAHDVVLEIDDVFVTLSLDLAGRGDVRYTHHDLLTAGNRFRILGDPGSGKSSLTKRLYRDACRQVLAGFLRSQSRLPILIELKTLRPPPGIASEEAGPWFFSELERSVAATATYRMDECFRTYAETVGLLVLLDGLDEVSSDAFPAVRDAINGLGNILEKKNENNVIVLTMRSQFHQQVKHEFSHTFPLLFSLSSFTPTDIYTFLSRWPFGKDRASHVSRIFKDLTDLPNLRDMCRNPLVLAMYVAEDQASGSRLVPESRTEFYSKVLDELLIRRRRRQTTIEGSAFRLKERRQQILGRLAYEHILDASESPNRLHWRRAVEITQQFFDCDSASAEEALRELAKETGLVQEEQHAETLRFIHLTFCEFLAAVEAVQGQVNGWETLCSVHERFWTGVEAQNRTRLHEVVPFACALLPRVMRPEALNEVEDIGDGKLLAKCLLETKLYEHPTWRRWFNSQRAELLTSSPGARDEAWLRDLHWFNTIVRDANQCSRQSSDIVAIDLGEIYRQLVDKEGSDLSLIFGQYASQDAAAAFRLAEMCHLDLAKDLPEAVIGNCDQEPFAALVFEQASQETEGGRRWVALLSEAGLRSRVVARWLRNQEPKQWLRQAADKVRWQDRWFGSLLRGRVSYPFRSCYTELLTLALGNKREIPSCATHLRAISRQVKSPGRYLSLQLGVAGLFLAFLLATVLVYPFSHEPKAKTFGELVVPAMGVSLIPYVYTFRLAALSAGFGFLLFGGFRGNAQRMLFKGTLALLLLPKQLRECLKKLYGEEWWRSIGGAVLFQKQR